MSGTTQTAWTLQRYFFAVVKLLLEKNADVNAQDKDKHTALMILLDARNNTNSLDTAKILLEKGADPNAQSDIALNSNEYEDNGSDSGHNGGTPKSVSILDQAKTMLERKEKIEREAIEESKKMQKMVQLLEQYADKKGF